MAKSDHEARSAVSLPNSELVHRIRRAVMISMSLTGEKTAVITPSLYTHDDYDDAMAALNELQGRADAGHADF